MDILSIEVNQLDRYVSSAADVLKSKQQQLRELQIQLLQHEQQLQQFKYREIEPIQLNNCQLELVNDTEGAELVSQWIREISLKLLKIRRNYQTESLIDEFIQIYQMMKFTTEQKIEDQYLLPIHSEVTNIYKLIVQHLIEKKDENRLIQLVGREWAAALL